MNDPDDTPQAPDEPIPDDLSPSERLEELMRKMAAFQAEMQDLYARISLIDLPPEDDDAEGEAGD